MGRPDAIFGAHWDHEPDRSGGLRHGVVLRLGRSADSRVYQYLWESTYFATIFLERHRVRMLLQFWQLRFGCGSAALRCIAGCQPAGDPAVFPVRAERACGRFAMDDLWAAPALR